MYPWIFTAMGIQYSTIVQVGYSPLPEIYTVEQPSPPIHISWQPTSVQRPKPQLERPSIVTHSN